MTTQRTDYIRGLREMADWLEAHPDVPAPCSDIFNVFVKDKERFLEVRRAAGLSNKSGDANYVYFYKVFSGDIRLEINIKKELTCERVKVGEKVIPAKPARTIELPAEPEKREEVFEWRCPESLLKENPDPTTALANAALAESGVAAKIVS
jgi:hypothetical protein